MANFKVAITEMYPRIPWKLVTDLLGSTEHTLGTAGIGYKINLLLNSNDQLIVLPHLGRSEYVCSSPTPQFLTSNQELHMRPLLPRFYHNDTLLYCILSF